LRENLPISPMTWLSDGPIVIDNPTSVLATFKQNPVSVVRFSGPHAFYRAAGWDSNKGRLASAYGSWWADSLVLAQIGNQITMFEKWLPTDLLRRAWPAQYRGATALCENWNDMKEMFRLDLPASEAIFGLAGLAAAQPQFSRRDPASRKTPMFAGGAEQIYFKRTPTLNSVNPLWVQSTVLW
jgi:hypothetical protein